MKTYNIYPNFRFQVEEENERQASIKAYKILKEMTEITYFDFDFDIEEEKE